jgi:tryptophan-rich sensory protein
MKAKNKTQSCLGQNICVDDSYAIDIIFKSIRYFILFIPLIIGMTIGAIYGKKWNDDKYKNLKKPEYNPPNYVFGIVWPILYLLIGGIYSYALYDSKCIPDSMSACSKAVYFKDLKYWIIPIIALIFNFLYIPVFFSDNGLFNGFIIIVFSLLFAVLTLIQFVMQNSYYKTTFIFAIIALVPYIIWLSFATYLSYNIYILNK